MTIGDLWTYPKTAWGRPETATAGAERMEVAGFSVEAVDGNIGKVDEATYDVGASYVVIDTGPWIFGKKVMLPAGIVDKVDRDTQTLYVKRSKDEIKNAPEFDEARYREEAYRTELGGYYGTGGAGVGRTDEPVL